MRIMSAIYLENNGDEKEIQLRKVTSDAYKNKLKGKLRCPMKDCPARISFSGGKYPHFKTWRFDKHSVDCLYYFDRIPMSLGRNATDAISVEIPHARRRNALDDAYIQMNLSDEEKKVLQKSRSTTRTNTREITKAKVNAKSVQLVLFDGGLYEDELIHGRRNISKRFVDEITELDFDKVRLVMGKVKNSIEVGDVAEIVVENNDQVITVVFEEAFTAEPLNRSYLNKFWSIKQLLNQHLPVQFIGIGDIRKKIGKNRLELVIFAGTDFRIDGGDLSTLATQLTIKRHGLG